MSFGSRVCKFIKSKSKIFHKFFLLEFPYMTMPFLASLNGSGTALIDYDCSNLDVNLVFTSLQQTTMGDTLTTENYFMRIYAKPFIYAIIMIILLSIKKLRVKLSSRMLVILCLNEIMDRILQELIFDSVPRYSNFWMFLAVINNSFNMIWISIISYEYLVVLR